MEKDKEEKVEDKKEDKVEDASPEYISSKDVSENKDTLATIPLPPNDVLKSAFLTAIKYRSVTSALKAYNSSVEALVEIKNSTAGYNEAVMRVERTIETLNDAQTIHQSDKNKRDAELLRSEQHLEQMKHNSYLAEKQREVEKHNATVQHEQLMGSTGVDDLTEVEKEVDEHLRASVLPARIQALADAIRAERPLSDDEELRLARAVEEATISVG